MLTFRKDDMYGDYPTLEEIKRDYNELKAVIENVTTIEQVRELENKFTIEINGMSIDEFLNGLKLSNGQRSNNRGKNNDIEWIRYEAYGCLAYIYVHFEKGSISCILFDVWSNKQDDEFITDTSITEIEKNYEKWLSSVEEA